MLKPKGSPNISAARGDGWYAVSVLLVAYTFSFIDRTIVALLVVPIKADLGISDTQVGLLIGLAFALFYTLMGLPIGRLADQYSRRWIISIGVFFWSLFTAACGLANSFVMLFLARLGVGVGEAALSPSAYSMIADYFDASRLGRALGVYSAGVYVGAGLAFIIGGDVIQLVSNAPPLTIPMIGTLAVWQITFFAVGFPGIFIALLTLTIKEPPRKSHVLKSGASADVVATVSNVERASISKTLSYAIQNWRTFGTHFLGFSCLALTFNAVIAWAPTMFIRKFGWDASEAGYALGINILIFGTLGIILGGMFADSLTRRGKTDSTIITGIVSAVGVAPAVLLFAFAGSAKLAAIAFAPVIFFSSFAYGAAAAALQLVSPNHMRAQISALYLFMLNLIGIGLGPTLVAVLTDYFFKNENSVDSSIALAGGAAAIIGGLFLVLGRGAFRKSIARISSQSEEVQAI